LFGALVAPGGLMILEIGDGQAEPLMALARSAAPQARLAAAPDLAGAPRALVIDLAGKNNH
jgi:hypothetical protein